ncbi:MAG: cytochrome c biogenesis protein CcsA [Gammaproteobacteria bacterium]
MSLTIIAVTAIILYLAAAILLGYRFFGTDGIVKRPDGKLLFICFSALVLHGIVLYQLIFTAVGLNMGFYNALSLVSWAVALLAVLTSLVKSVQNLVMVILPMTALALLLEIIFPSERIVSGTANFGMDIHIILSISAYSLLTIAAIQAVVLAIQEHQLRAHHPVRVMRILPPMQTMEELLVQLLWAGFFLLSLGLATGLMFVHDILGQHLIHKTVLSIMAWLFFALVLFGRWAWGWRGKYLVRCTLGGFVLLMLAYFGSKLVLEVILDRI